MTRPFLKVMGVPMFRLVTFGRLALTNESGVPVVTQRRRLALLALLASARDSGLSRDKLVAYLWPESSAENARHSLEQLFYALRRDLGDGFGVAPGAPRLDPRLIVSDLFEFERALDRGECEIAVALYAGPFLDGFYLTDAAEFERWVEQERSRLGDRFVSALEHLAREAAQRHDHSAALAWAKRLAAVNPLSASAALTLLQALVSVGNSTGALEYARVYKALIRDELDGAVDPEIATFVSRIRAHEVVSQPSSASPFPVSPTSTAADDSAAADESRSEPRAAQPTPPSRRSSRRMIATIAGVAALSVLATMWTRALTPNASKILIPPFRVTGSDSLGYLREGIVDILAAKFTGEGGPVAIDARTTLKAWRDARKDATGEIGSRAALQIANDLGAGRILLGEVVRMGDGTLVLSGTMLSVPGGDTRVRSTVSGSAASLLLLIDRLAAELLARDAGEDEQRVSSLTSTSLPALRAFLAGRKAYRGGDYDASVASYTRALELDSAFALAGLELAATAGLSFNLRPIEQVTADQGWPTEVDTTWRKGVEVATRGQGRLGARDRAYLVALRGSRYPFSTTSRDQLENWERAVDIAPDRADGWYRLGHTLLYHGPAMGLHDAWPRAAGAFHRALQLDSTFVAPLGGLIEVAAFMHDTAEVRLLGATYLARDSVGENADYFRWRVAAFEPNSAASLRTVRARFRLFSAQTLSRIQWTAQVGVISIDDAALAIAELERRAANARELAKASVQFSHLATNRGRAMDALRPKSPETVVPSTTGRIQRLGVNYALFWDHAASVGEESVKQLAAFERDLVARGGSRDLQTLGPLFSISLWRLSHGDTTGAARTIAWLRAAATTADSRGRTYTHWPDILDAMLAAELHRPDAGLLLRRLDSLTQLGCCATPHMANFVVARLWERAESREAALAAVRRARWYFPPEYLSSALREEGRLAALTGDRAGAIRAYRDYLALRRDPEPTWHADAERVRATLKHLEQSGK